MALTIKWQRWDAASYDWLGKGANDALPALTAEMQLWMDSVNSNASNVDQDLRIDRDANSSLANYYAGFVISAGAPGTTERGYMFYGKLGSSTAKRQYALGNTYNDGVNNGGYGTVSGYSTDTSVSWYNDGKEANWLLCYDDEDGKEFFFFGPTFDTANTTYEDGFGIYKRTTGAWAIMTGDAGTYTISYKNTSTFSGWTGIKESASAISDGTVTISSTHSRYSIMPSGQRTEGSKIMEDMVWYAANPKLLTMPYSTANGYVGQRTVLTDLGDGTNVFLLTMFRYAPMIFVDLRP